VSPSSDGAQDTMPAGTQTSRRRSLAGQKAALRRSRTEDDPEYVAVCRDLVYEQTAEYIEKQVSQAPPFTREQVDQLRVLLEPARRELAATEPSGAA